MPGVCRQLVATMVLTVIPNRSIAWSDLLLTHSFDPYHPYNIYYLQGNKWQWTQWFLCPTSVKAWR